MNSEYQDVAWKKKEKKIANHLQTIAFHKENSIPQIQLKTLSLLS